ncbi:MAG: hypothetical protein JXR23_10800 [Pontiellaceae bacterium]|nr:hypothetical protein [Pontiellaceae bacterium]
MSRLKRNDGILSAALLVYALALSGIIWGVVIYNGHISYTLDDAYIHMAMAKHVAQNGVFGITPYEFSASSSSPLWTLLLAGIFFLVGPLEWMPLLLNGLCGMGILVALWKFASRTGISSSATGFLLFAAIAFLPMIPIAMTGMEHLLHAAAILAMAYTLWPLLNCETKDGYRAAIPLGIWSAVAVSSRFETLFTTAAIFLALALVKKWKSALVCGLGTALPVFGFGFYSLANGQSFLPNSVLIKGSVPDVSGFVQILNSLGMNAFNTLVTTPHLFILVLLLAVGLWKNLKSNAQWTQRSLLAAVVIVATLLHLQFAKVGWFYRYESYLIALSLASIALLFNKGIKDSKPTFLVRIAEGFVIVLCIGPLAHRAVIAHCNTPQAAHNIYQQQYQSGLFLKKYYNTAAIAANDIGAINFLASPRCLDLWGLGSRETMLLHMKGALTTHSIREITQQRKVKIALVYESWFHDQSALPEEWINAGTFTIQNNVICGDESVSFFAVDPAEEEQLRHNLREFSKQLPEEVSWTEAGLTAPETAE